MSTILPAKSCSKIKSFAFEQPVSPTLSKIMAIAPELILGTSHLFTYNESLSLSPSFQKFLRLLVHVKELGPEIFESKSLEELVASIQNLKNKEDLPRQSSILKYSEATEAHRLEFNELFYQLGFTSSVPIRIPRSVNQCLIFGGTVGRINARMQQTLNLLKNKTLVVGNIFILTSSEELLKNELDFLRSRIDSVENKERKVFWEEVFKVKEEATEANACAFLWEYLTGSGDSPQTGQVFITCATKVGHYYHKRSLKQAIAITKQEWQSYSQQEQQSIFAWIEQPFGSLRDEIIYTLLSQATNVEELQERVANTKFYFAIKPSLTQPSLDIMLKEIAKIVQMTAKRFQTMERAFFI